MLAILAALYSMAGSGGPVTRIYTSGTGFTETVPPGVTQVKITLDGPGGAGARDNFNLDPTGGGGGARCVRTIAVSPGETFTCSVGPAAAGRNTDGPGATSTATTVAGTVTGGTVNMSAGPGTGGGTGNPGVGGTASGGTTNTAGSPGGYADGGAGASGAAGGSTGTPAGSAPGGGGLGKVTGTSGAGARGQIEFQYS